MAWDRPNGFLPTDWHVPSSAESDKKRIPPSRSRLVGQNHQRVILRIWAGRYGAPNKSAMIANALTRFLSCLTKSKVRRTASGTSRRALVILRHGKDQGSDHSPHLRSLFISLSRPRG